MLKMTYFDECQILGSMEKNPQSLMLITVMKNLQKLGYELKVSVLHFCMISSLLLVIAIVSPCYGRNMLK